MRPNQKGVPLFVSGDPRELGEAGNQASFAEGWVRRAPSGPSFELTRQHRAREGGGPPGSVHSQRGATEFCQACLRKGPAKRCRHVRGDRARSQVKELEQSRGHLEGDTAAADAVQCGAVDPDL